MPPDARRSSPARRSRRRSVAARTDSSGWGGRGGGAWRGHLPLRRRGPALARAPRRERLAWLALRRQADAVCGPHFFFDARPDRVLVFEEARLTLDVQRARARQVDVEHLPNAARPS